MTRQILNTPFFMGPEETDKACLLVHGFSGTTVEMRGLGEALAAQGIRVHGIALPGHTGDPEDLARSNRRQWIASTEEGLAQLSGYPHVFVVGLSMGGILSLLLTARHPERIAGVVTLSTATRFPRGWQARYARYFLKWYYSLASRDFSDPRVQEDFLLGKRLHYPDIMFDFSDPQAIATIKRENRLPVSAIDELIRITEQGRRCVSEIHAPLLIIHSKRDETALPASADEIFRLATSASSKSLHWLEQSGHVITIGAEREEVNRLVTSFVEATIQSAAKTA
jgi:carboxylesterase